MDVQRRFVLLSLPKAQRIVRSAEFRSIYESGVRMTSRYFAAFCLRQPDLLPSRFGLTVPRAVGKAVLRNRIKRRMRAAVTASSHMLPDAWAIVFNPRRSVAEASFKDLCREVDRILSRCGKS